MSTPVVLFVDDEPEMVETVKAGLEERGYTVIGATSGHEGLEIIKKHSPDIIISDLRMSPMTGFDFYLEIKKLPQFRSIPILFLTAVDDFLARKYSTTLGVSDYITKPVDLDKLDTIIKSKFASK